MAKGNDPNAKGDPLLNSRLNSRDHLFTFLTAIVKKNGGKLIISEEDLLSVQRSDMVTLAYNIEAKELIFEVSASDITNNYSDDPKSRKDN
tara:strand:- start:679 stop:951 length:273 start_codon:yes stop_codon:yes gene_type:complete